MSSPTPAPQSEPRGGRSPERAPQVVVRAGKTWICSACGVMVEVPPEVVGQMVMVPEPTPPQDTVEPGLASATPSHEAQTEEQPAGEIPSPVEPLEEKPSPRPTCPRRSSRSNSDQPRIDGLIVPTPKQLQRLMAWVEYRLARLDVLKKQEKMLLRIPSNRPRKAPSRQAPSRQAPPRHAHPDVSMAPIQKPRKARPKIPCHRRARPAPRAKDRGPP